MATPPFLLWDNRYFASGATLSASSEAAGCPAANAANWRPFDRWRAGGTSSPAWLKVDLGVGKTGDADTLILAAHNLASCGANSVILEYSDDGSSWATVDGCDPSTWKDEWPITLALTRVGEHRYWRVSIAGTLTKAPEVGIAFVGVRLEFPRFPPSWDPYSRPDDTEWNTNAAGQPLGSNYVGSPKTMAVDLGALGALDADFWKRADGPAWDDDFDTYRRNGWFYWVPFLDREPYHAWLSRVVSAPSYSFVKIVGRRTAKLTLSCWVPS